MIILSFHIYCQPGILPHITACAPDPEHTKTANAVIFAIDIVSHYMLHTIATIRSAEPCSKNFINYIDISGKQLCAQLAYMFFSQFLHLLLKFTATKG